MSCTNCYNGCAQTVSDKCVRYTGVDIPSLGISNGDTLLHVEQQLSTYLQSTLDATGIKLAISPSELCEIVSKYLPNVNNITALDLFKALKDASCDLQTQVTTLATTVESLNNYCTSGCCDTMCLILPENPTIKDVVMALVDKVCQLITDVAALGYDLETNYVKTENLNELIAIYLSSQTPENKNYLKMVPYVAYEYYGNLAGFGGTGIGTGVWEQVYLCNGQNGTPDRRGVVAVGATDGSMGAYNYYPAVDPATSGNPTYVKGSLQGANKVSLVVDNLPSHTHPGTTATAQPHHHIQGSESLYSFYGGGDPYLNRGWGTGGNITAYSKQNTSDTVVSVSVNVATQGGNQPHNNYQPGIGCYYIMYIPNA